MSHINICWRKRIPMQGSFFYLFFFHLDSHFVPKTPEVSWNISALYKTATPTKLSRLTRHMLLCWASVAVQAGCLGWSDAQLFQDFTLCCQGRPCVVRWLFQIWLPVLYFPCPSLGMCTHNIVWDVMSVRVSGNLKRCHKQSHLVQQCIDLK